MRVENKNKKSLSCLNPCCNGIYSMRLPRQAEKRKCKSLNPCCNGIYSMRKQKTESFSSGIPGLNPCCNGIYSMSYIG